MFEKLFKMFKRVLMTKNGEIINEEIKQNETTLEETLEYINSLSKKALFLTRANCKTNSRFGEKPNLPNDIEWPSNENGYLTFLCQIDLSEVPTDYQSDLPEGGMLFFFYDIIEQPWGFELSDKSCWRVIYSEKNIGELPERGFPENFSDEAVYPRRTIAFEIDTTYPYNLSAEILSLNFNDADEEKYSDLEFQAYESRDTSHQMFGYPAIIQNDEMAEDCQYMFYKHDDIEKIKSLPKDELENLRKGVDDWVLLLQLDSEAICWGDSGMIYFWIRKQDLKARNFENVWLHLQCY
ncbi:YwqG family protein [Lentisphaerota bacterium WC36G]|nr:DUF1963 domain-containing protein [Lentisphaerae bacterium WC36]